MSHTLRLLVGLLVLSGCKATPDQLAAARCNPAEDLEQCDDSGMRRMVCNPANGQWTPFVMCYAPDICQLLEPGADGRRATVCAPEQVATDDVVSGDAVVSDAAPVDAIAKDTQPVDAKADVHKPDGDGQDSADAAAPPDGTAPADAGTGLFPNQVCFQKHCPSQTLVCIQSSTCIAAIHAGLDCVTACGGGQGCIAQCQGNWASDPAAFSLASCGLLICGGGCGDGVCSATETPTTCPGDCKPSLTGSCVGHCGGKSTDCFCDGVCKNQNDCCNDYYAVCGG